MLVDIFFFVLFSMHFLLQYTLQLCADWCSSCSTSFSPTYVYIKARQTASVWMEIQFSQEMYTPLA